MIILNIVCMYIVNVCMYMTINLNTESLCVRNQRGEGYMKTTMDWIDPSEGQGCLAIPESH